MRVKIGVMGSADGAMSEEAVKKAYRLGQEIARRGCVIVTGGCPGLPYDATRGAKAEGGITVGVSPALNLEEHINRYDSPVHDIDVLIFTGQGLMGREATGVRTCDIVITIGGRSGTLGEFAIAYDEGKLLGVVEGTGGISDEIRDIAKIIEKPTGVRIYFNSDPVRLIDDLLVAYNESKDSKLLGPLG